MPVSVVFEPRWRELGVDDGALDGPVPEVVLDGPCVVLIMLSWPRHTFPTGGFVQKAAREGDRCSCHPTARS